MKSTQTPKVQHHLIANYCDSCIHPSLHDGCGSVFRSLLEPIACPPELSDSHYVCEFCLEVTPKVLPHRTKCVFANNNLKLHAAGWSTPASASIFRAMRRVGFKYSAPIGNLLKNLLQSLPTENCIIVPIPMTSPRRKNLWLQIVEEVSATLPAVEARPLLLRDKQRSTRKNLASTRRLIVQTEYSVDEMQAPFIEKRRVILLDDNVTTGLTLVHCANLLRKFGPEEIEPVALERHVSTRVLQRCPPRSEFSCQFYSQQGA